MLLLFELCLCGCPYLDHRYSTGQLCQPLLQLLPVEVRGGLFYLSLYLLHPPLNIFLSALTLNNSGIILVGHYRAGSTQIGHSDRVKLPSHLLRDYLSTGQNRHILEHGLAAVAKARGLNRQTVNGTS